MMSSDKVKRRTARLIGGLARPSRAKCCFVHIPKCAGNSIASALIAKTPINACNGWIDTVASRNAAAIAATGAPDDTLYHEDGDHCAETFAVRRDLAAYHFSRGAPVIAGHILFDPVLHRLHMRDYRFATMLRDPVDRMVSHYREEMAVGIIAMPFEAYLETSMARRHANTLTRYLAGIADLQVVSADAVETAKRHLDLFDVVGLMDRSDDFARDLSAALGTTIRLGHQRKGRGEAPVINDDLRRRLEEMCAGDAEVYAHARALKGL